MEWDLGDTHLCVGALFVSLSTCLSWCRSNLGCSAHARGKHKGQRKVKLEGLLRLLKRKGRRCWCHNSQRWQQTLKGSFWAYWPSCSLHQEIWVAHFYSHYLLWKIPDDPMGHALLPQRQVTPLCELLMLFNMGRSRSIVKMCCFEEGLRLCRLPWFTQNVTTQSSHRVCPLLSQLITQKPCQGQKKETGESVCPISGDEVLASRKGHAQSWAQSLGSDHAPYLPCTLGHISSFPGPQATLDKWHLKYCLLGQGERAMRWPRNWLVLTFLLQCPWL